MRTIRGSSLARPQLGAVWRAVASSVTIPSVDTKTRLVVAVVFLLVVALLVIAGLIALASPAK
jgi:hypothetical protein